MRNGGTSSRDHNINESVMFEPEHAEQLIKYLKPHIQTRKKEVVCLDAFAGDGALGNAIKKEFPKWYVFSAEKEKGIDVFEIKSTKFDVIITNPWWSLKNSLPAFNHLQFLLKKNGVLIFVINNVFCYQGSERGSSLFYQKFYFLPRWTFESSGRSLLDCGVMVCHKNGKVPKEAANLRPFIPLVKMDKRYFLIPEPGEFLWLIGLGYIQTKKSIITRIKATSFDHALKKYEDRKKAQEKKEKDDE